jgi:O-succinylbenzoic acid--CoA ligase
MPKITTHNLRYSSLEVENLVTCFAASLMQLNFDRKKNIAFLLDISLNSVVLVLAAVRLGLKVAFCSSREPDLVTNNWLLDLDINILIISGDYKILLNNNIIIYSLENIINNNISEIPDQSQDFVSYIRTSGTTSEPKSALISFEAHRHSALSVSSYFNFDSQQCWALSLPIYHVSGLSIIFRALLQDAEIYIAAHHQALLTALSARAISHCSLVPAQLKRLLNENVDLSALSALITGGDALKLKDRERALAQSCALYESYGMCETASMIAVKNSQYNKTTILAHADIKISEDHEILVKSTSLFSGYWSQGILTRNLNHDGYFPTGDKATLESFSTLDLIHRKNNRIISGGENIQAEEIEQLLEQHEAILECVVVAKADAEMGARPVAFIKWLNQPLGDHELYNFLAPQLASFKHPVSFLSYPLDTPESLKKPRRWLQNRLFISEKHIVEL